MPSVGHPAALKFRLSILRILFRYQCLTPSNRDCLYHFHSSFWLWFQDLNFSPLVQRSEEETVLINNKSVTKAGNNAAQLPGDLFYLSLHLDTNAVLTFRELAGLQTFRWSRSLKFPPPTFPLRLTNLIFNGKCTPLCMSTCLFGRTSRVLLSNSHRAHARERQISWLSKLNCFGFACEQVTSPNWFGKQQ